MRFGNCPNCSQYKYIRPDGICPSCTGDDINIRIDMIYGGFRSPDMLKSIGEAAASVPGVCCECSTTSEADRMDDLDVLKDHCRLYSCERKYEYDDYDKSEVESVKAAIRDALSEAKQIYG